MRRSRYGTSVPGAGAVHHIINDQSALQQNRGDSTKPIGRKTQCACWAQCPLIQGDLRSGCAIQQPLEMEAGKLIIGVLANMRREGRHCAGVAGFQLGERL